MSSFEAPLIRGRNDQIDTLRAIACIGLVAFHVVGSSSSSGLELDENHWLSLANLALVDLRMPLFSFLSGMVFPVFTGSPGLKISAKVRRLLLPMVTVGSLFWLARNMMGYTQQPFAEIFFMPFAHFWFLQATFLIMTFCIIGTAIAGGRDKLVVGIIGSLGAALYISSFRFEENIFAIMHAWKLAPFFAAGFLFGGIQFWRISRKLQRCALLGLMAAVLSGFILALNYINLDHQERRIISLILGLAFCISLLILRPCNASLAWLGRHSYPIYLFHVFFTAGTVEVITRVAPNAALLALFFAALVAGLVGPAALSKIFMLHPLTALFFLGLRKKKPIYKSEILSSPQGS